MQRQRDWIQTVEACRRTLQQRKSLFERTTQWLLSKLCACAEQREEITYATKVCTTRWSGHKRVNAPAMELLSPIETNLPLVRPTSTKVNFSSPRTGSRSTIPGDAWFSKSTKVNAAEPRKIYLGKSKIPQWEVVARAEVSVQLKVNRGQRPRKAESWTT